MISHKEAAARADNNMLEIDAPPMAYFEIPINENAKLRITFKTIIWPITQEHVEDNMQKVVAVELVECIKNELFKVGGGIIWWRTRPALQVYDGPQGQIFKVRCRVDTTPALDAEAWARLHHLPDGSAVV